MLGKSPLLFVNLRDAGLYFVQSCNGSTETSLKLIAQNKILRNLQIKKDIVFSEWTQHLKGCSTETSLKLLLKLRPTGQAIQLLTPSTSQ